MYPIDLKDLILRVPSFARKILVCGCGEEGGAFGGFLHRRGALEVHGIEWDPVLATKARSGCDTVLEIPLPCSDLPFPAGYFDIVIIPDAAILETFLTPFLANVLPLLQPYGFVVTVFRNRHYWRCRSVGVLQSENNPATDRDVVDQALQQAGLVIYAQGTIVPPGDTSSEGDAVETDKDGCIEIGGQRYPIENEQAREALLVSGYCLYGVRPDYNPILHAREVLMSGRPESAFDLLNMIPEPYQKDPQVVAIISSDIMMALLALDSEAGEVNRLNRFALSLQHFHRALGRIPQSHFAYQCQAEFWRRIGNDDMACRLLRSILYVAPDAEIQTQLDGYLASMRPDPVREETMPCLEVISHPVRILYILHPRPHYGIDILYDGLCNVLGEENVVDFPWKPWFHGELPTMQVNYPCVCNRPGTPLSLEDVEEQLRQRQFDLILFGDMEQSMPRDWARRIVKAAGNLPLYAVDQLDESVDMHQETLEHLGVSALTGYFKREMLFGVDYGPNTFPLPFAYPERRIPTLIDTTRTIDFFWAGKRGSSMRGLFLDHLQARYNRKMDGYVSQEEYVQTLLNVRIGIDIFGHGFDTVRYWELPAHGCMLLAERRPIHIPNNFRDAESAVFFGDTQELEAKLAYYLAHPEEASAIALAGREHLMRYHTATIRARQALACIEQTMG